MPDASIVRHRPIPYSANGASDLGREEAFKRRNDSKMTAGAGDRQYRHFDPTSPTFVHRLLRVDLATRPSCPNQAADRLLKRDIHFDISPDGKPLRLEFTPLRTVPRFSKRRHYSAYGHPVS